MEFSQKIIIIGGNHHNTLGVIRSLGRVGLFPFVILTTKCTNSFVLKSKYIQKSWVVNDSYEAIKLLMSELATKDNKHILIACHDGISSVIDLHRDVLQPYFELPGMKKAGELTRLMNKKVMGELAAQMGMDVPETQILNKSSFAESVNIPYPCITKPIDSKSGTKSDIVICNKHDDLASFFDKEDVYKSFIIQQYIIKDFEFQLIGCSLDSGKEIIIPGVSKIIRQTKCSNTGFLYYTHYDGSYHKTIENTKLFIRKIGYSGLFSVEFLRDKNGMDYFMEMNFRNDGNTISVTNAGVNLPYIWCLYCAGADYKSEIEPIHDEYVMPEFDELSLFRQRQITWKQWKEDMHKATSYMDYAIDDPAPTEGWSRYNKQKRRAVFARIIKTILCK